MTTSTNDLLENAIALAHDFYTSNEEMLPQLLFESKDGTPIVIVFPFSNSTEKHAALDVLRGVLQAHNATAYTIMAEGWATEHPNAAASAKAVRPSLEPNRMEILTIFVVQKNGESTGTVYEIKREGTRVTNLIETGAVVQAGESNFGRLFEGVH